MKDSKILYAQSSDIKSRTYLEYRKDRKQKAIAELEILPWLRRKIQKKDPRSNVKKFGGDQFLWFLRKGGITREPDFIVEYPDKKTEYIELQYAKKILKTYDFKISKIAPKNKKLKKRIPKKDTKILYIIMPSHEFAILDPSWIIKHSKQTIAPAWGNAPVFSVPEKTFKKVLKKDRDLKDVRGLIEKKSKILNFQHEVIEIEKEKFSYLFQQVLDEEKVLKILPKTLDGFFKVCFTLCYLEKTPKNTNLWLVYLLSFLNKHLNSYAIFQMVFCVDFLYSKLSYLKENELDTLVTGIKSFYEKIKKFSKPDGSFRSAKTLAPLEDTRYSIFSINILEDLTQDILFYHRDSIGLQPVNKIFQTIPYVDHTFEFITNLK